MNTAQIIARMKAEYFGNLNHFLSTVAKDQGEYWEFKDRSRLYKEYTPKDTNPMVSVSLNTLVEYQRIKDEYDLMTGDISW